MDFKPWTWTPMTTVTADSGQAYLVVKPKRQLGLIQGGRIYIDRPESLRRAMQTLLDEKETNEA